MGREKLSRSQACGEDTEGGQGEVEQVPGVGGAPEGGGGGPRDHLHALAGALALAHQEHREAGAQHRGRHCQAEHQQQVACNSLESESV